MDIVRCGHTRVRGLHSLAGTWEHKWLWRSKLFRNEPSYNYAYNYAIDNNGNCPVVALRGDKWLHFELGSQPAVSARVLLDIADILQSLSPDLRNAQVVIVCPVDYTSE